MCVYIYIFIFSHYIYIYIYIDRYDIYIYIYLYKVFFLQPREATQRDANINEAMQCTGTQNILIRVARAQIIFCPRYIHPLTHSFIPWTPSFSMGLLAN
jgi:hypothetical protein